MISTWTVGGWQGLHVATVGEKILVNGPKEGARRVAVRGVQITH